MIIEILFVVCMLLWFLSALPYEPLTPYRNASYLLAWLCVLFLGLYIFAPGLRG